MKWHLEIAKKSSIIHCGCDFKHQVHTINSPCHDDSSVVNSLCVFCLWQQDILILITMNTCMNAAMFRLCLTQICTLNIDRSKYCYIQPPVKFIKPIELQMNQYNLIHDLRVIICQKYVGFSLDLMPQTETPSWLVIPNQCRIVTMCITNKLHSK